MPRPSKVFSGTFNIPGRSVTDGRPDTNVGIFPLIELPPDGPYEAIVSVVSRDGNGVLHSYDGHAHPFWPPPLPALQNEQICSLWPGHTVTVVGTVVGIIKRNDDEPSSGSYSVQIIAKGEHRREISPREDDFKKSDGFKTVHVDPIGFDTSTSVSFESVKEGETFMVTAYGMAFTVDGASRRDTSALLSLEQEQDTDTLGLSSVIPVPGNLGDSQQVEMYVSTSGIWKAFRDYPLITFKANIRSYYVDPSRLRLFVRAARTN